MRPATDVFLVAAKRTAFGTFGGKLKHLTATELATHASKAALAAANIDPKLVASSIVGNVAQTSVDAAYIARHVGLKAGLAHDSNALAVNRLCGSGFQAMVDGAYHIAHGDAPSGIVLAVGTESMSQAPLSVYGQHVRFGHRLGEDLKQVDTLWSALTDSHCGMPMGITAENLATKYKISRAASDESAHRAQPRWAAAQKAGAFAAEIAPIEVKGKKGMETFAVDEHPRPETTLEGLSKLTPVFKKDATGTVTAGGASGICDGAAALVLASGAAVAAHKLTPLARLVGWAVAGVDPSIMGIGPAPAIRALLARTGRSLADIDLIEVNEAFAPQVLSVEAELGLPSGRTNVNGGAIALGHPLGASGARIAAHLAHQLAAGKGKLAIGSACIGGGQGIAVLLERA